MPVASLWAQVPEPGRGATGDSDFWDAYEAVLPTAQPQASGKEAGPTNHVERWNNTLRQRVGQFVRKTLLFSKCDHRHHDRLLLFLHRDNQDLTITTA